jgi:serpin B
MSQKRRFTIRQTEDAEALEMPCKGSDRSVHFILPKTRMGLASVENKLNIESIDKLLFGEAPTEEVQLGLPKFKIESSQTLNQPLAQLGMPTAFSNTSADFSGMNGGKEPLKIDAVLHKAVLVVDELGAEAAAATAVVIGLRSMPAKPPRSFLVDQPFLVAISDKATRSILFLGRVTEPAKV